MNTHTPHIATFKHNSIKCLILLACSTTLLYSCDVSKGGGGTQAPDPVAVDLPIAYIERPLPRDEEGELVTDNALDPTTFRPGARLIIKDRATVPAAKVVITDAAFVESDGENIPSFEFEDEVRPMYDVKDLEASSDGQKLIFSMRAPEDPDLDEDEQPTWNIWEYDRETEILRRIINSNINAEAGQDVSPHYLPDGRIVFSSTRQRRSKAILLDENKPQFSAIAEQAEGEAEAFLLHVMGEDGLNIKQISFNQSHDLQPSLLNSGEILFLRWNGYNNNSVSLYKTNPDGSNTEILYGHHSQETGTNNALVIFKDPKELPDGSIMVNLRLRDSARMGGDIALINTETFIDNTQPTNANSGLPGPAQTSATFGTTNSNDSASPQGFFNSAYPLADASGRFIVSWSGCSVQGVALRVYVNATLEMIDDESNYVNIDGDRVDTPVVAAESQVSAYPCTNATLQNTNIAEADPLYGIWVYNTTEETLAPVVLPQNETMYTEVIVLENHPVPNTIPNPIPGEDISQELVDENLGIVHIRSVYDYDGTDTSEDSLSVIADPTRYLAADRPARFLRIVKAVSMPPDEVRDVADTANGVSDAQAMKEILGYVPVEPDGSAMFTVPADVAFSLSVLDTNGRRISDLHQNWLSVAAGETKECNGCHAPDSTAPHGRTDAVAPSANPGALISENFVSTTLRVADINEPNRDLWVPAAPPEIGETMAEYYARINGPRQPSLDIYYTDDWTDPAVRTPDAPITGWNYLSLPTAMPPVPKTSCLTSWDGLCRTVINYLDHIQPIWESPTREVPNPNDPNTPLIMSCTNCHSLNGITPLPAGQLELTSNTSDVNNNYVTSYAELLLNDNELEEVDGQVIQREIPLTDDAGNPLYEEIDDQGNAVLDDDDDPVLTTVADDNNIPALQFVVIGGKLNAGNANGPRSRAFFARFAEGGAHEGRLQPSELKLLSEWLDLGAQYYNNPFDAPEN